MCVFGGLELILLRMFLQQAEGKKSDTVELGGFEVGCERERERENTREAEEERFEMQ